MKKTSVSIISVILAFSIIFSGFGSVGATAAGDINKTLTHCGVSALEGIIKVILGSIAASVPDSKNFSKLSKRETKNFYSGTENYIKTPAANAKWSLGYSKASLIPQALKDGNFEGDYYLGGYMMVENGMKNKVEEIIDDMMIRVIAISDGSDRGISIFANVDCIGFCNGDIRDVRALVANLMPNTEFNSINISSTHSHSCLDTQGLWTNGFPKIMGNIAKSFLPFLDKTPGVNQEWMNWAKGVMANAIKESVEDMTEGKLTYCVKELNKEYFDNRNRKSSTSLNSDLVRFIFTPDNTSLKPTMLVNINAHPDVAGMPVNERDNGRQISGDYVYYLGDEIEKNGYNFMFVNGAIAGIYFGRNLTNDGVAMDRRYEQSERYGREMGQIALNLTNDFDTISANADWETINRERENNEHYTLWFENWTPVAERELEPKLNIIIKEVPIRVTNPLMIFVAKLELCNYAVYKDGLTKYYMISETGYCEFGDVKVVMLPGEVVQDIVYGGDSLTAAGSFKGKDFGYDCLRDIFGQDTICFGLMNDACGYVVPDNDYSLGIVDDHYQELISLGDQTASSVVKVMIEISNEITTD